MESRSLNYDHNITCYLDDDFGTPSQNADRRCTRHRGTDIAVYALNAPVHRICIEEMRGLTYFQLIWMEMPANQTWSLLL